MQIQIQSFQPFFLAMAIKYIFTKYIYLYIYAYM